MNATIFLICCTGFVAGAYSSAIPNYLGVGLCLLVGGICAYLCPKFWQAKDSPPLWVYLVAGAIGGFACVYVLWRTPAPGATDIAQVGALRGAIVQGELAESPTLSRSGRARFTLAVSGYKKNRREPEFTPADGNLYVTVPILEGTGRRRGQTVEITGNLYQPSGASNPGGFDFRQFLARRGIFAGMTGRTIVPDIPEPSFGEWWITGRMARAHVLGAGVPEGTFLSSLVLGNRAVDLPNELRDSFMRAGLAAALAASGFQVSIILAAVLAITGEAAPRRRLIVGVSVLLGYQILTGASPSVLRAVVMGIGGLIGLTFGQKMRPLAGLFGAAVFLLLLEPNWIYDLGFQFSFMATFGLMTTANPIMKRLASLPPLFAELLSVPIAAYVWTLPIQLLVFGKVSPYSILANVLTTALVSIGTIGSVICGLFGVIFEPLGAGLSWLLYPIAWLNISIARWINTLPGAATNAGSIELWQLAIVYGIFVSIWLAPTRLAKYWLPAGILSAVLLFAPGAIARANLFQVTVMASRTPTMIIQNQGRTALINSGSGQDVQFTIYPYLQQSGINALESAIVTDPQPSASGGWQSLRKEGIQVRQLKEAFATQKPLTYQQVEQELRSSGTVISSLSVGQTVDLVPEVQVELINAQPSVLKLTTKGTVWLFLGKSKRAEQRDLARSGKLPKAKVLWWNGDDIGNAIVRAIAPEFVIASGRMQQETSERLEKNDSFRILTTNRDGAVIWTPANGIETLRDADDTGSAL